MQLTASLMRTLLVACDQSYKTTAKGIVKRSARSLSCF
jgi:hypothetical protein